MTTELDTDHLRSWIGREDLATDEVGADLVHKFNATFDVGGPAPSVGTLAPRFIHFCLAQAVEPMHALGRDGHPARGGFLPPVPLPRRMRAGGQITFYDDLRVGDRIERKARITEVAVKEGKSGRLCFVTVQNRITVDGNLRLVETEDIVYRDDGVAGPGRSPPPAPAGTWSRPQLMTTTMLFRYSALTFNGHRIHYDRRYVTQVEGYPGLIVHGPLIATLLVDLVRRYQPQAFVKGFQFKAVRPTFDLHPFHLNAQPSADGRTVRVWAQDHEGWLTMQGDVQLA